MNNNEKFEAEVNAEYTRRSQVVETRECVTCHQPFDITVNESEYWAKRGLVLPTHCPKCLAARHSADKVAETRECVTCHKTFTITQGQKAYMEQNGQRLPTHCSECHHKYLVEKEVRSRLAEDRKQARLAEKAAKENAEKAETTAAEVTTAAAEA